MHCIWTGHGKSPATLKTKGPVTAVLICPSKRALVGHPIDTTDYQESP